MFSGGRRGGSRLHRLVAGIIVRRGVFECAWVELGWVDGGSSDLVDFCINEVPEFFRRKIGSAGHNPAAELSLPGVLETNRGVW